MAYGHSIRRIGPDHYRLFWTIDRKVKGSRLRYPTTYSRDTDEKGALRFADRWSFNDAAREPLRSGRAKLHEGGEDRRS